jgi:acetylornithine deacetylase
MKVPFPEIIALLKSLISTPSFSKDEGQTAELLSTFLKKKKVDSQQYHNNVWALNAHFNPQLPTLLLNSHHDTVQPVSGWKSNPFGAEISEDGKLYGLGSNDAGGSLVALLATFLHFYDKKLDFNLIFAATAEEEISGKMGIESLLPLLGKIDVGIVGEPTQMNMAISEKGLLVLDGTSEGKAGHAARDEGENALYAALDDIQRLRNFKFEKESELLGSVKVSVTQIQAGAQHNVVPDSCKFVVDVRSNELYSNTEIYEILQAQMTKTHLKPRSLRLNSSKIDKNHSLVTRGKVLGLGSFGSPTLSDQALMPFPTVKIGCGDSARSHTAEEFIFVAEIEKGIEIYTQLLEGLILRN